MKQLILVSFLIALNVKADDFSDINTLLDGLHEDAHKGNLLSAGPYKNLNLMLNQLLLMVMVGLIK